jgi:Sulfotransferase domain
MESTHMSAEKRIAMWSGPRNISTAMMRAWGNRADTALIDEPFYAFYLAKTKQPHPGAAEIISRGETDWRKVIQRLTGPIPGGKKIFFQKQMTHHLLPEVSRDWLAQVKNCFLIRDPADVIVSYAKKNGEPRLEDLGFVQQLEVFHFVRERTNREPPVIDAKDVLQNPERALRLLCQAIAVEFDRSMLSWRAGRRESDGVWAKYWYGEVERSNSFQVYHERAAAVPSDLNEVYARCRAIYEELYKHRIS